MKQLLFFVFLCSLHSFGQANKLIRQGLRSTNATEQIDFFSQAIALEPKNLDAHFYRGIAKYNLGDYNGAILDYTKVIFYKPDADTYYNRGNSKFALQDYNGAKEDYKKAIELDPELIDAIYNLGLTTFYLGDFNEALTCFTLIISQFPDDAKAYNQRALAYMELKDYKEAFIDFARSIFINPNSNAFYSRGCALLSISYYKEAQADLYKALRLDKNNTACYFFIGATHLFLGEYEAAITGFSKSIELDDSDFDAHLGLAMAYYKGNDLEKAKMSFQKAKHLLIDDGADGNGIEVFDNTYWYKNQSPYFNEIYKELEAL